MGKSYDIKRLLAICNGYEYPLDVNECCFYNGYVMKLEGKKVGDIISDIDPSPDIMNAENLRYFLCGMAMADNALEQFDLHPVNEDDSKTH